MNTIKISLLRLDEEPIFAGRLDGKRRFVRCLEELPQLTETSLVVLDFRGVHLVTSSFFSELVVPLRDHLRLRRPASYLVVANLAGKVAEELDELLIRTREAVLCCTVLASGAVAEPYVLGQLEQKLRETLNLVLKRGETTAVQLRGIGKLDGIGATGWNNRLTALANKSLLLEISQGRAKKYRPLWRRPNGTRLHQKKRRPHFTKRSTAAQLNSAHQRFSIAIRPRFRAPRPLRFCKGCTFTLGEKIHLRILNRRLIAQRDNMVVADFGASSRIFRSGGVGCRHCKRRRQSGARFQSDCRDWILRVIKPIAEKRDGRNLRRERRRWDDADSHSLPLGCFECAYRELCGGIRKKLRDYDCLGDCCSNPANCDNVCPRNFEAYVDRYREVDGFDLHNIPRARPCLPPDLPSYIPLIFHRNRRAGLLDVPAVALPLHKFYSRRDGSLRYKTRAEIEDAFRVNRKARIILVGCGRDKPIEAWWNLSSQRRVILSALADLGIELITAPNYSLFTDVPRHDNMYNIKRIGIAWYEAIDFGNAVRAPSQRTYGTRLRASNKLHKQKGRSNGCRL